MNNGTCKYCNAEIVWAETEAYKDKPARKMPCDPGEHVIMRAIGSFAEDGETPIVRYAKGYVPHWASCTNPPPKRERPSSR